jgi:hypothetical protein
MNDDFMNDRCMNDGCMNDHWRKTLVILNSLFAAFFAAFLAYTFFAREHLNGLAQEYVTTKTEQYAEPVVDLAQDAVRSKTANVLLSDETLARVQGEIDAYRRDAKAYIRVLTVKGLARVEEAPANPVAKKVVEWKQKVADYYHETLDALIADLRIVAGSNLAACVVALVLAAKGANPRLPKVAVFSAALFIAVGYCTYMYIDSMSFFLILTKAHIGWWYPALLVAFAAGITVDLDRFGKISRDEKDS